MSRDILLNIWHGNVIMDRHISMGVFIGSFLIKPIKLRSLNQFNIIKIKKEVNLSIICLIRKPS